MLAEGSGDAGEGASTLATSFTVRVRGEGVGCSNQNNAAMAKMDKPTRIAVRI
jgi:hypothetical protein